MDADNAQTPEEITAALGGGSVAEFVGAWVDVVLNHQDWATAMGASTLELRLATAQEFILGAERHGASFTVGPRDELAAQLATIDLDHPLWNAYAEAWLASFDAFRGHRLGIGTRTRPIDIDHEGVVVIDYEANPGETRTVNGQEMKFDDGHGPQRQWPLIARRLPDSWLLAGFGEQLPRPGWPPFLNQTV